MQLHRCCIYNTVAGCAGSSVRRGEDLVQLQWDGLSDYLSESSRRATTVRYVHVSARRVGLRSRRQRSATHLPVYQGPLPYIRYVH